MLYPTITPTRNVIELSGIWNFKLDNGETDPVLSAQKKLTNSSPMAVPASYNDIGVVKEIKEHIGFVWYEKEIYVPNDLEKQRIVLRFGSATHLAKVYLNGALSIEHKGGFLPFELEVNNYIEDGKLRITIALDNTLDHSTLPVGIYEEEEYESLGKVVRNLPNFDFFNYAGLQRPIKLYTTPHQFIKDVTIVTDHDGDHGTVKYSVDTNPKEGLVRVTVIDEDGNKVAACEGANGEISISDVNLWEPLNAYLYTMKIELINENQLVDVYEESFGVRTIKVEGGQFFINHKPFYFKGFGKHEDSPIHGRGFSDAVNVMDFNLMKWMGANSFRTAHYPYSEELMRLADREGFVVIDETPAVGLHFNFHATGAIKKEDSTWERLQTFDHHRDVLEDMIARDKNHPCVVMWSVANEAATEENGAFEYFEPLVELTKGKDPQKRPVTIITYIGSSPEHDKIAELVDVLGLNRYYGWYEHGGELDVAKVKLKAELEAWQKRCPDKPIMMTEYGADTMAGFHEVAPVLFTEEYQNEYLRINHEIFDETDVFIGEHVWNFADFATSQNIRRVNGNKKGVFTRERKPKASAHMLRKRWMTIPDYGYKVIKDKITKG
ncbi:beta-glucuronidase [Salimicrobium halophilum]|uniref:Beta-glucuronidase n=1 Tax=Salimicrobium halophilum TaxID=86666 RepID=A0A1G8T6Q7_9BACI|nr:beta-glucuronidase [Salimicrobium halophilum]SDJ37329.1 beta-glucuronidase [Salimicrobium halophilum]